MSAVICWKKHWNSDITLLLLPKRLPTLIKHYLVLNLETHTFLKMRPCYESLITSKCEQSYCHTVVKITAIRSDKLVHLTDLLLFIAPITMIRYCSELYNSSTAGHSKRCLNLTHCTCEAALLLFVCVMFSCEILRNLNCEEEPNSSLRYNWDCTKAERVHNAVPTRQLLRRVRCTAQSTSQMHSVLSAEKFMLKIVQAHNLKETRTGELVRRF